jgi:predicted negative regulator of RcsB-dependent stress response
VDLLSDEDQWEQLKAWLRGNGLAIVGGVLIGVLGLAGWRWWQGNQEREAVAASVAYEKLLSTFDSGDLRGAETQIEAMRTDHPKSGYLAAADLAAAKVYVARNELDKAALRLQRVADSALDVELRPIARLRLARVQLAQGKPDEALATLAKYTEAEHKPAYTEMRGDILLAKGDRAGALRDYEAARAAQPAGDQGTGVEAILDLKINDLRAGSVADAGAKP